MRARRYPRSMSLRKTFLLVAIGRATYSSLPATLRTVDVSRRQDRYRVVADTHLEASPEAVYKVLLDFDDDRYQRISEIYKESSYLAAGQRRHSARLHARRRLSAASIAEA